MLLALIADGRVVWRSETGARELLGCPGGVHDTAATDTLDEADVRLLTSQLAGPGTAALTVNVRRWDERGRVPLRLVAWREGDVVVVVGVAIRPRAGLLA